MEIPISEIKVGPGRRGIVYTKVIELSESMSAIGLLNPVTVDQNYVLIAGMHRLEAAKQLSWTTIECTVTSLEGLQAELAEIDENVVRARLSRQELGDLLARRKEIYEKLNPEAIARNRPGHVSNYSSSDKLAGEPKVKSFSEDTAEKLGISPRTVDRMVWIAEHMIPEAKEILRGMKISQDECYKLAKLSPVQQRQAASMYSMAQIPSVDEYIQLLKQGKAENTENTEGDGMRQEDTDAEEEDTEPEDSEPDAEGAAIFTDRFTRFSRQSLSIIEDYSMFDTSFAALSSAQVDEIQEQANNLCTAIGKLMEQVRSERYS